MIDHNIVFIIIFILILFKMHLLECTVWHTGEEIGLNELEPLDKWLIKDGWNYSLAWNTKGS